MLKYTCHHIHVRERERESKDNKKKIFLFLHQLCNTHKARITTKRTHRWPMIIDFVQTKCKQRSAPSAHHSAPNRAPCISSPRWLWSAQPVWDFFSWKAFPFPADGDPRLCPGHCDGLLRLQLHGHGHAIIQRCPQLALVMPALLQ